MKIAVVGAGVAGLACARRLVEGGHAVTVFEREDTPGGRIATLRTEVGGFDHGAQYLTARDPAFGAAVASWRAAGVVAPWPVVAGVLDGRTGGASEAHAERARRGGVERIVGVPGMGAIASHLATGLDVRYGVAVLSVDRVAGVGTSQPAGWRLRHRSKTAAVPNDDLFDAMAVALPAELAVSLLRPAPTLAARAAAADIAPCWALLLAFAEPVLPDPAAPGDAAFVEHGRLAWIARESSKPGRRIGERWTAHAQSGWSVEHFDDDPDDARTKLVRAFQDATGSHEQPLYAVAYRWRHALARVALDDGCLWDADLRIGACGDWCRGSRIEDAWASGVQLADTLRRDA